MTNLQKLLDKAIKALPAKSPVREEIAEALATRTDYAARGRKAWETRRATNAAPAPKPIKGAKLQLTSRAKMPKAKAK